MSHDSSPKRFGRAAPRFASAFAALLSLLALSSRARADDGDREIWTEATLVAPIAPELKASIDHHVRFDQNGTRLRRFMPEPAVDWTPIGPLTLNATYRLVIEHDGQERFAVRHRPHLQTTLSAPLFGAVEARWRARYQIVFARVDQRWTRERTLRNRLVLSWNRDVGASPFIAGEYFAGLGNGDGFAPNRWRTSIGADWGACDAYYRVQGPLGASQEGVEQILGLGWVITLD